MSVQDGWKSLRDRVRGLEDNFIPAKDETGSYTDEQRDSIAAFLVLSHSEIESYVEDSCHRSARALIVGHKQAAATNQRVATFIQRCLAGEIARQLLRDKQAVDAITLGKNALRVYQRVIRVNHGIRRSNVAILVWPLGIAMDEMDVQLLEDLDQIAQYRGMYAHRSIGARTDVDPVELVETVNRAVTGLREWGIAVAAAGADYA